MGLGWKGRMMRRMERELSLEIDLMQKDGCAYSFCAVNESHVHRNWVLQTLLARQTVLKAGWMMQLQYRHNDFMTK